MALKEYSSVPVAIISSSSSIISKMRKKLGFFDTVFSLEPLFIPKEFPYCLQTMQVIFMDISNRTACENEVFFKLRQNAVMIALLSSQPDSQDFCQDYDDIIWVDEAENRIVQRIIRAICHKYDRETAYISKISQMETFNRIISELNKELHMDKLLSKSIESLKKILGVEKASILLFEDEDLIVKACMGLPSTVRSGFKSLRKDTISYFVAKNKQSIIVNDIEKEDRFKGLRSGTEYKKKSFISTPIMFYDTVIGVINLNDRIGGDFTGEDLGLLQVFSSHFAINVVNAHLFLDLKDKAANLLQVSREKDKLNRRISRFNEVLKEKIEQERQKLKSAYQELLDRDDILQKKILELISLKKAGKTAISELFNLELVLDVILNIALREVDALRGSIVIKDKEGELVVKAAAGEAKDIINTKVEDEDSVTRYIFNKGESLLISDIEKHPLFQKADISGKYNTKSLLSLPLKAGNQIYGVMNVNNKHNKRPFNSEDLDILAGLANQASMAIHNFYLSESLKDKEISLQQAEKMAEIGNLVVAVAHELRNPLGILRTNIEFLRDISGNNRDVMDDMINQINRARRFIKDLMQFGKPTILSMVNTNIIDVIELSINHAVSGYIHISGLKIERSYSEDNISINIDPMKIQQVIINLIINALDELKESEYPVINVSVKEREECIEIGIEDNGGGVPDDIRDYIFNPFFSSRKGEGGTGLGLSIAKRIVEMHGGQIILSKSASRGAKFCLILPK